MSDRLGSIILFFPLLILSACQVNVPSITSINWRLYIQPVEDGVRENLSFFTYIMDDDGIDDIAMLYLINDETELVWGLSPESWVHKNESGANWIGSNGIAMPDGLPFPRGKWRVVVADLAGERNEHEFTIAATPTERIAIPKLKLIGSEIELDSPHTVNTAFFMNAAKRPVRTINLSNGRTELDRLWGSSGWRSESDYLAIYSLDLKSGIGAFSWTLRLPD